MSADGPPPPAQLATRLQYCKKAPTSTVPRTTEGLFLSCDVLMAQFIVHLNASMPVSESFIVHILDPTHMFIQPHMGEFVRRKIAEFSDQNSYKKPT
ncbi:unnamed protein product [Alopecurus aequalis]